MRGTHPVRTGLVNEARRDRGSGAAPQPCAALFTKTAAIEWRYTCVVSNAKRRDTDSVRGCLARRSLISRGLCLLNTRHTSVAERWIVSCGERFQLFVVSAFLRAFVYASPLRAHVTAVCARALSFSSKGLDLCVIALFCCACVPEKCKRFLQEFYSEDDSGKKVFKYGAQLVRSAACSCSCSTTWTPPPAHLCVCVCVCAGVPGAPRAGGAGAGSGWYGGGRPWAGGECVWEHQALHWTVFGRGSRTAAGVQRARGDLWHHRSVPLSENNIQLYPRSLISCITNHTDQVNLHTLKI